MRNRRKLIKQPFFGVKGLADRLLSLPLIAHVPYSYRAAYWPDAVAALLMLLSELYFTALAPLSRYKLRTNTQHVLATIRQQRPQNTHQVYNPKQREFKEFCQRKQYLDNNTITEDKLLLFLVEEVAGRLLRAKSWKVPGDVPQDETRLSWRSVYTYVTAIADL
ncbi:hypothetical protein CC78DRAFT_579568 [Lojkania enalia]|uniref:Uncharacterized protein n=1 Tax=Lojkania enalia TaxID=147567 RepID=A0A9P4K9N2_9PLEO|nr:hypothetical protein CC78DRAFT_579568 [Didymosphaeria enalia]